MHWISWLLVGGGVVVFIHSWRQAREAVGKPGGIQRLKRWRLRLMLAMLALAPLLWVLLQVTEGDTSYIVVGVLGAAVTLVLVVIETVLGWHEAGEQQ